MEFTLTIIVTAIVTFFLSFLIGNYFFKTRMRKILKKATAEGEVIKKDKILQAKETFLQLKNEHEKSVTEKIEKMSERTSKLKYLETDILTKEKKLKRREEEIKNREKESHLQLERGRERKKSLDELKQKMLDEIENISGLSKKEIAKKLEKEMIEEAQMNAMSHINDIKEEAKMNANKEATRIILQTIQRIAAEKTIENCVSTFTIENEAVKGKIIGREGRNIRSLEATTGVEFIVDDTPDTIIISCFDPVRREIARQALSLLLADGRIHPARIEEVVKKVSKQIEEEILTQGKQTIIDLGIQGLHPELIRMVGRMRYRSSYGQNLLMHSREVATLCANMASELGLNVAAAKRAGLLHDIGKVYDEEIETPHALVGMKLAEKYNEKSNVCNAIGAHHEEIEMTDIISPIIQVCDAISGARPGARREVTDSYIKRLKELEEIGSLHDGVQKAFAIQSGRELRVIVDAEAISDTEANTISLDISKKIQEEMVYPGQIKVIVIREKRAVSIAK